MRYLIKLTPLEPYIFGTEQGFAYPGETGTGKESYFVKSAKIPEQTTILGMLRYVLLSHNKLLNTSFSYQQEELEKMEKLIGSSGFSFGSQRKQEFGIIEEISPLFLMNEKEEVLVTNPFHNVKEDCGYEPMPMSGEEILTEYGKIRLPETDSYKAKKGYGSGYVNITDPEKKIEKDLFSSVAVTGNRKNKKGEQEQDAFFKKEMFSLKKGYCFAVLVDLKEDLLPEKTIVYMGKKKSAFLFQAEEKKEMELISLVKNALTGKEKWYYALSDVYVGMSSRYTEFCIVENKYQRNLETVYKEDGKMKLKKSPVRFELIKTGSVFYGTCPEILENENCAQIGYNKIIELGGV